MSATTADNSTSENWLRRKATTFEVVNECFQLDPGTAFVNPEIYPLFVVNTRPNLNRSRTSSQAIPANEIASRAE